VLLDGDNRQPLRAAQAAELILAAGRQPPELLAEQVVAALRLRGIISRWQDRHS